MLGFYDYTVVLTYIGALCGLMSMILSMHGNVMGAIYCLAASLFCDTMDGKVARAKKNRTEREMRFGVQIDSLCDVISFGVAPAGLFYCLGLDSTFDLVLLGAYCLCCVIRLGFFNTLAEEAELGKKGDYHGLPVVCLTVMVPAVVLTSLFLTDRMFCWVMRLALALFGFLYILDFRVKKPNAVKLLIMVAVFWIPVGILALFL